MAKSGSISGRYNAGTANGLHILVTLYWEAQSISFANNSTTIKYRLTCTRTAGAGDGGKGDWNVNINGTSTSGTYGSSITTSNQEYELTSGTLAIPHNADGTKYFSLSFSYTKSSIINTKGSGTAILDAIPRPATIVKAEDFNDEDNPVLYYSNPSGSTLTALEACISFDGSVDDIAYREIPKIGIEAPLSYTFNLTDADRQKLWEHLGSNTSGTVRFYLRSKYNNETVWKYAVQTLTLINHEPIFNPVVSDINRDTVALTGDSNIIIKYHSNISVNTGVQARKGASISSIKIECGSQTKTTSPATIFAVESPDIIITAKDTRNITTSETVTKNFIDYIHPTCNLRVPSINTFGETTVKISGNCFKGSFGAVDNLITVRWRYKEDEGAYGNWHYSYPTIQDDNTYHIEAFVEGLDYTKLYTFEAAVTDELETVYSAEVKMKTVTVFDWSKTDFNFNVPVNFSQGFTVPNRAAKQLWNGQAKLYNSSGNEGDDTIGLLEPVSAQASGIVLIFTPYNSSTGVANDAKMQAFFIPKMAVFLMPSKMHTFMLTDGAKFNKIGAKSVYIGDSRISGYADNSVKGSSNGISYDNTAFCLRYIIGV